MGCGGSKGDSTVALVTESKTEATAIPTTEDEQREADATHNEETDPLYRYWEQRHELRSFLNDGQCKLDTSLEPGETAWLDLAPNVMDIPVLTYEQVLDLWPGDGVTTFDTSIDGEAGWHVIPEFLISNDVMTESQKRTHAHRQRRTDLDDEDRMSRRRKTLAEDFVRRYELEPSQVRMLRGFADRFATSLLESQRHLQTLCQTENYQGKSALNLASHSLRAPHDT